MNILEEILGAQNGQLLEGLANQFGLSKAQAGGAVGSLLPAVSQGLKREMASRAGRESLAGALASGDHGRYIDDLAILRDPQAVENGNGILGHIFGSKDVSREVAGRASTTSGVDPGVLRQMLPIIAGMAMGALSKRGSASDLQSGPGAGSGSDALGGLSSFLDMDGDGSVADDLFDMARKLF